MAETIRSVLTCKECRKPIATEAFCSCKHFAGQPSSLTPEMLSEEDRSNLTALRMFADPHTSYPCCDTEMDRFAKLRAKAFDWADRLLGSPSTGEG